jgi:hypothetical protein
MSEIREIAIEVVPVTPEIEIGLGSASKDLNIEIKDGAIPERDYEKLIHHPQINSVTLIGNKTSTELGLQDELPIITRAEIREIINNL